MRYFIAIPISDEVRKYLTRIQEKMESSRTKMKLVEPENIHVTMLFLGEFDDTERIKKAMDSIKEKLFEISITHLDAFPSKSYVKVIWAGIEQGKENLINIHQALVEELSWKREDYIPHITLARVKTRLDDVLKDILEERFDLDMVVDRAQLMKSELTKKGPIYGVIYEKKL